MYVGIVIQRQNIYFLTFQFFFNSKNSINDMNDSIVGPYVWTGDHGSCHMTGHIDVPKLPGHHVDSLPGAGDESGVGGGDVCGVYHAPGHVTEQDGLQEGRVGQQLLVHLTRQGLEGRIVWSEDGNVAGGFDDLVQLRGPQCLGQLGEVG